MVEEKDKQEAIEFLRSKEDLDGLIVLTIADADKPHCRESCRAAGTNGAFAQMIYDFLNDNKAVKAEFLKIMLLATSGEFTKLLDQINGDDNDAE